MSPVALVTGASSGIGAATARLLTRRGFDVYGTSRRPDTLAPQIRASIRWLEMDVRDEASVQRGVHAILAANSRLDALVCNAG